MDKRSWPALDIQPVSDLVHAALVDFEMSAVEERSDEDWRVFFASAAARDRAREELGRRFPGTTLAPVDVPDENWAARSQATLRAVRIGRIVVAPPWDAPSAPPHAGGQRGSSATPERTASTSHAPAHGDARSGGALAIVIAPSMGFGTGHHATTRLCLAALQRLDVAGRAVVDVGTGSGVLAIAASLMGASRVLGIDDDADAIASARESLELNPGADVTLLAGDLRSTRIAAADIVVANLTGGLLRAAARSLEGLTAEGGRLVLSGLMDAEERDVVSAFPAWGVEDRLDEDGWLCVTLARAAS